MTAERKTTDQQKRDRYEREVMGDLGSLLGIREDRLIAMLEAGELSREIYELCTTLCVYTMTLGKLAIRIRDTPDRYSFEECPICGDATAFLKVHDEERHPDIAGTVAGRDRHTTNRRAPKHDRQDQRQRRRSSKV